MATIESLDLATLTNNPQSIAEALEDVLETTSGTIGNLKTNAQNNHDEIENLLTSAQSDLTTLQNAINNAPSADVLNLDFSINSRVSSFTSHGGASITNLNMWQFLDFMFISFSGSHNGTPSTNEVFGTIDAPYRPATKTVFPGNSHQGDNVEYFNFETNGNVQVYYPENVASSSFFFVVNGVYKIED